MAKGKNMLIRDSPSVVRGGAWWHHSAQKIQTAGLLRDFRLFEDKKVNGFFSLYCGGFFTHCKDTFICKHHVKVNFASMTPLIIYFIGRLNLLRFEAFDDSPTSIWSVK